MIDKLKDLSSTNKYQLKNKRKIRCNINMLQEKKMRIDAIYTN